MTTLAASLILAAMEALVESGAPLPATEAESCPYVLAIARDAPELLAEVDIADAAWDAWVGSCALLERRAAAVAREGPAR